MNVGGHRRFPTSGRVPGRTKSPIRVGAVHGCSPLYTTTGRIGTTQSARVVGRSFRRLSYRRRAALCTRKAMNRSTRDWNSSSTTTYTYSSPSAASRSGTRQTMSLWRLAKDGSISSVCMRSARSKSKRANHSSPPSMNSLTNPSRRSLKARRNAKNAL